MNNMKLLLDCCVQSADKKELFLDRNAAVGKKESNLILYMNVKNEADGTINGTHIQIYIICKALDDVIKGHKVLFQNEKQISDNISLLWYANKISKK